MAKQNEFTQEDDDLLAALGVEVEVKQPKKYTNREQRIIAGFEEIQQFVDEHGRLPRHGEDNDIFERLYAVRLDQIRKQKECRDLLADLDPQGLLAATDDAGLTIADDLDDDELLAQLGVTDEPESSIKKLRHVRTQAEKKAAEEIANRTVCEDFEDFQPLFETVQKELDAGLRETVRFRKDAGFTKTQLVQGLFLIVGGQVAFIAERGEPFKAPNGEEDARLRVIYSNGTESNILLRSLIRAMYKDETSRFITEASGPGGLFAGDLAEDDQQSGTIYVLRSHSDHPTISTNREVIHKIGVTGNDVKKRIANAKNDATFLLADVEVVATYKLANIYPFKLEKIIHKFLEPAKLEIEIKDRFGKPVTAREWFLVPLPAIDEMVDRVMDGTIREYYYDVGAAVLRR
ncbi:GIY-YIG nuclease family protein [Neolewinella agarilytica]|uniref:GIY-YIG nuclease family protein n=1 Tax=Neolewinella agarilytica TaxID=478744 RepID=UPI002352EA05|nr:GIY-YIG nuclease family protein [Neolewinella agarilytica]